MSASRVTVGWPALIAGGIGLLAAGAGIAYVAVRPAPPTSSAQSTAPGAGRSSGQCFTVSASLGSVD